MAVPLSSGRTTDYHVRGMRKILGIVLIIIAITFAVTLVMKMAISPNFITNTESKRSRMLQQLAASPEVDLLGVVDASGVAGTRNPDDELWDLSFTLTVWRTEGTPVNTNGLTVRHQMTYQEMTRLMDRITPYTVVHIRAHLAEHTEFGNPQALLVNIVGVDESDAELNKWVTQLLEPVMFDDDMFGTFTLDRRLQRHTAQTTWRGTPVALHLSAKEPDDLQNALKTAHTLWQSQDEWDQRIRHFAVVELLPLKNDVWLDEDEVEVHPDQFKDRMALETVKVYPDGSFEFWHNDGDLFFGHSIRIDGSISDGPTDADIPG